MNKVAGLARALAILLAIVTGFVAIPGLDIALALVVLGLIAGIAYCGEDTARLVLTVLVLPVVATALANIPMIGEQLAAIAGNVALAGAGAAATAIAMRLYTLVKGDLGGLVAKG